MNLTTYNTAKTSVAWYNYPTDTVITRGKDRFDLLQRMTTNNVNPLIEASTNSTNEGGAGIQNIFVTDKARIIDVFTALAFPNELRLLCSHGFGVKIAEWLDKYTFIEDMTTEDVSPQYASVLVFGPRALQLLEELSKSELQDMRIGSWKRVSLQNITLEGSSNQSIEAIIIKQQPLCEFCYCIQVASEAHESLHRLLRSIDGVAEADDSTFQTLRIEAAWGQHGKEWTEERNPLEAGLVRLVDFTKGCYIGQEVIARLDTYNKVKVRYSGVVSDTPIPTNARFIDRSDGKENDIGGVTSVTYSPELQKHIALAYIRSAFANPTASIEAVAEGYSAQVEIVKLPFVM